MPLWLIKILRKIMLCLSLSLSAVTLCHAADLMTLYQLALKNDAHLQAVQFEFKASSEAVNQAIADLLPQLSFDYTHTESRQEIISSQNRVFASAGISRFPIDNYNIRLNVPVFHYDNWVRMGQTDAVINQARSELLAAEQQMMIELVKNYFDELSAENELAYVRADKKAIEHELLFIETRVKQGLAISNELMALNAQFAKAQMREIEAEEIRENARQELKILSNKQISKLTPLIDAIPLQPAESDDVNKWLTLAYSQNHALKARQYAVEIADKERQRQFAGHLPTFDVVGNFNNRETGGSLFGGGSEVQTFNVNLQVNVPIFQGGKVLSKTREADFRHKQLQQEYEQEKRQVEKQVYQALKGIQNGIKKIKALNITQNYQTQLLKQKKVRLMNGLDTQQSVLEAERDFFAVKKDYFKARYDYLLSILQLKQATGTLSPDNLKQINGLLSTPKTTSHEIITKSDI